MHGFKAKRTWVMFIIVLSVTLLLTLLLPTIAFAQPDGPPSALDPASPAAAAIADLHNLVLLIAIGVFAIVEGLILYAAFRFRRKPKDTSEPAQIHGDTRLEIAWTVAPALIVVALFVLTLRSQQAIGAAASSTDGGEPIRVEVVGHQWWWEFRYPDLGIVTAGNLVIPAGRVVNLEITSVDVIHSFWVPQLAGKTDAVQGVVNRSWLKADRPGEYFGQCAELCGVSHANMRFVVTAVSDTDFSAWAQNEARISLPPTDPVAIEGQQLFVTKGCIGCHTIGGMQQAVGLTGPNLTHVAGRPYIAGGILSNTTYNLGRWLADPPGIKAGSIMPNLGLAPDEVEKLIAFLQTLN
jgi:cytochrome c oxidase subunit 2